MMAGNTESVFDFGFAPKKKVATYGKSSRRRTETAARPATLRHAESAPVVPSTFADSQVESSGPPRLSTRAITSTKVRRQNLHETSSETRQLPPDEVQSQPLPDPYDIDSLDETTRTKRRRVGQGFSDKGRATGPYTTPDSSPPGARSPLSLSEEEIPRSATDATPSNTSKRSTPERDVDMKDDAPISMPFSAKTTRRLKNLSVSSKNSGLKKHQIPIRLSAPPPKPAPRSPTRLVTTASNAHEQAPAALPIRKRRLIDALVAQAREDSSASEDEASSQGSAIANSQPQTAIPTSPPPVSTSSAQPPATTRPVLVTKKTGPKFTYSQQRSMLADDDDPLIGGGGVLSDLGDGPSGGALFNLGRLTKSATINTISYLDEDDDTANAGAVRSIHELRQAGANSRFADEMDDILDRVGLPSAKPSSLRRGALLELAQKLKEKDFRQQFRNHSDGGSLFRSLADETDLISGYAILAIVTTLLAATTSAHLIQQLRSQGLATLVSKLLDDTTDIGLLVRDRKQNVSRNGQVTISNIKSSLLELPVWKPFSPTSLSPRTLALKCLDLLMRQPTHASAEDDVLSQPVTDRLFSILADGVSDATCWDFPNQNASCDFYLALYVLEGHSVSAMQSRLHPVWTKQYAPIIAEVLEAALERPTDQLGDLESLTLRISLNITNHNEEASRMFVEKGLLRRLAEAACSAFEMVMNSMKNDAFMSKVLESLIMMLGAMINFCVYYPPASGSLEERGDGTGSPLNRLIRFFADNHSKTADADSMEKTQLNVALGYLSVLLGYLSLSDSIRDRFILVHPKKNIQPLLDSINEFITFHRKVAEAQGSDGGKQESGSLARLQDLANHLTALR
ncbi:wings apart-like protein regulation of heterochromatin-domain-containing protein [Corynascus similis CBS 632.67]